MSYSCLHELINSNLLQATQWAAFKTTKRNPQMLGGTPHFCIPFTPSYVTGNLLLPCVTTWRESRRTAGPLMAVLILRYFTLFLLHVKELFLKWLTRREKWGRVEESRIEARENQTSAWDQQAVLGRGRCLPTKLCHSRSLQGAMGLQQGDGTGRLDVETCCRISKEEEKQAEERKRARVEVGDRRLKFGLWLVEVRRCPDKASGERGGNPNPVRESGGVYLQALGAGRNQTKKLRQVGWCVLVYHFMEVARNLCILIRGFQQIPGRLPSLTVMV